MLLAFLIKGRAYDHIGPGSEHEAKQLFSEIVEFGLGDEAFGRLREAIQADVYREDGHLESLEQRFVELEQLFQDLQAALAERHSQMSSAWFAHAVEEAVDLLRQKPETPAEGSIFVVGFTTIRPYYRPLFAALAKRSDVDFWITQSDVEGSGSLKPLKDLLNCVEDADLRRQPASPDTDKHIRVIETESLFEETAAALKLAQEYIDRGFALQYCYFDHK